MDIAAQKLQNQATAAFADLKSSMMIPIYSAVVSMRVLSEVHSWPLRNRRPQILLELSIIGTVQSRARFPSQFTRLTDSDLINC
eukprot:1625216-Pleurochrysis_carterae.AAC.7